MISAIVISCVCVFSYVFGIYKGKDAVTVSGNSELIIEQGISYEGNVLIPYQKYTDIKKQPIEQMRSMLESLKGTLLSYDSKIVNLKEDKGFILLEVNDMFFTLDKGINHKIAEALNYVRKLFYPSYQYRIYINNTELLTIPQTDIEVSKINMVSINLFNGDAISGYPVTLIENNILKTHYVKEKCNPSKITEYYRNSVFMDTFTVLPEFVEDIRVIDGIASIYLNDCLLDEENQINEDIISDYLIILFINNDFRSIFLYLNDEPYFYRGANEQELKMFDIVYNLRNF